MKKSWIFVLFLILSLPGFSDPEIILIEKAISWVNPKVSAERVSRYAPAIVHAAKRFDIDPLTLVAIAHQESSFRENLPMGRAGELGMLQIRKTWLSNKKFRKVFKRFSERDLKKPETAFLAAAWILSDLKKSPQKSKLPFWTYYNARQFRNRFKYYLRVNRHLSNIESNRARYARILLAVAKPVEPPATRVERNIARKLLEEVNWTGKAIEVIKSKEEVSTSAWDYPALLKKGIVSLFLPHES